MGKWEGLEEGDRAGRRESGKEAEGQHTSSYRGLSGGLLPGFQCCMLSRGKTPAVCDSLAYVVPWGAGGGTKADNGNDGEERWFGQEE